MRLANENSKLSAAYNEFLFLDKCETFFQLTLQEKLESAVLPSRFSSLQRPSRQIFLYTPDIDEIDKMLSIEKDLRISALSGHLKKPLNNSRLSHILESSLYLERPILDN